MALFERWWLANRLRGGVRIDIRWLVVLGLVQLLALLALASCSGDNAEEVTGTDATTVVTSTSVATTEATSPPNAVVVSFDGTSCTYQGPEQVSPSEPVSFSFTNESELKAAVFVTGGRTEAELEEALSLIGQDVAADQLSGHGQPRMAAEVQVDPGQTRTHTALLMPGTWIVDCHTYEPGVTGPTHFWFVGALESN